MSMFNPCPECGTPIVKGTNCVCGFVPVAYSRPVATTYCMGARCVMPVHATTGACLWHYMTGGWLQTERTFEAFKDNFLPRFAKIYPEAWGGEAVGLWEKVGGK